MKEDGFVIRNESAAHFLTFQVWIGLMFLLDNITRILLLKH